MNTPEKFPFWIQNSLKTFVGSSLARADSQHQILQTWSSVAQMVTGIMVSVPAAAPWGKAGIKLHLEMCHLLLCDLSSEVTAPGTSL